MTRAIRQIFGGGAALTFAFAMLVSVLPVAAESQPATIRLWDFHIHDKKFRKSIFDEFNKANPDIKVVYTSQISSTYNTILDAALRTGDPPDIFSATGVLTYPEMIAKGWIMPLDDLAPSKEALRTWVALFPQDQRPFGENTNMFGGKIYSWPISSLGSAITLFWNTKLFADAGIQKPAGKKEVLETLADVRQAAKKITELGQGKVYGITQGIKDPGIWSMSIQFPAAGDGWGFRGGGVNSDGFNLKTGRYDWSNPGLRAHIQNWLDMKKDGSIFPGDLSMTDEDAKYKFSQYLAGMIYGGPWVPGGLLAINPTMEFDAVLPPTRTGIRIGGSPGSSGGLASFSEYVVSKATKNPGAVWRVINFMTSAQYQEGWVKAGGGFSAFPEYNKPEFFPHPVIAKLARPELAGRLTTPESFLSADANKVWSLVQIDQPIWYEVMQGMWIGRLGWEAWDDLERRSNAAFDKALAEAQKQGLKVTRADFTYPEWDMTKDYDPSLRKK